MLQDELAKYYYIASVDCGNPRRIGRGSKQFQFFERISKLLKEGDDPYTYFRVLFESGLVWPHEMCTQNSYSIYENWKLQRLSAGWKPVLKSNREKIIQDVTSWEEKYKNSGKGLAEFIDENKLQISPHWIALHDEWLEIKGNVPYELFRKVKEARIWLRKRGLLWKSLKELINE